MARTAKEETNLIPSVALPRGDKLLYRELGVAVLAITKALWLFPESQAGLTFHRRANCCGDAPAAVIHDDVVGSPEDPRYRDRLPALACC